MAALIAEDCLIVLVESINRVGEDAVVQFHTKRSVRLTKDQPGWSEIHQRLDDSMRRRVPIGIWLDREDRVVKAGWAQRDFLLNILEPPGKPEWCWVYFTDGSYPLRKSNPAFPRIKDVVEYCRATRSSAWLVTTTGPEGVELADAQVLPAEEDAFLCRSSSLGWA